MIKLTDDFNNDVIGEKYQDVFDKLLEIPQTNRYPKTVKRKKEKSQKRRTNSPSAKEQPSLKFNLKEIKPKTSNQRKVFESYNNDKNVVLSGSAGTGKTFLSMYLALRESLSNDPDSIDKIIIVRSATPTRDLGFLPGKLEEKMAAYEEPYKAICEELFGNKTVYDTLKRNGKLEFISSSYLRGVTFKNAFVIVDEAQSCTEHELDSVLTRLGENSKIFICGDFKQNDLQYDRKLTSGFKDILYVLEKMNSIDIINFGLNDIVRSGFVREYLIAKET